MNSTGRWRWVVGGVGVALLGTCAVGGMGSIAGSAAVVSVALDAPPDVALAEVVAAEDTRDLVAVAAPRELRAMWVATVANLDFPSRQGLPPERMAAELDTLVDRSAALGMNALVFQVRPEADAFYKSKKEPWSRFLTGKQGRDPGFDPLGHLITAAHARGIEVHAWFNPYRAKSSKNAPVADTHVSRWAARHTRPWGGLLWLDPGVPEVRNHAVDVVADVMDSYDIDGVHLDDYFYPYPEGKRSFPDDDSYGVYTRGGGGLERDAWRRHNVDSLVSGIAEVVKTRHPTVRFGISPFGIYRPGFPEGVKGLDQVRTLHADPMEWFRQGWIDYLAPQLYWTTQHPRQPYGRLVEWWNEQVDDGRPLFVGLDVTKVGKEPKWTLAEVERQVTLARAGSRTAGEIWFRADPILANRAGLGDTLARLYERPALPPPLARAATPMAPPDVVVEGEALALGHPAPATVKVWVLYRQQDDGTLVPVQVVGPQVQRLEPGPGTWVVSAVNRVGVESLGLRVMLPGDALPGDRGADAVVEAAAD
jgi:uncharacterized lipoprotein YddW (UPF0748 family)